MDFTLHAVARLKEEYPQLRLVIIGAPRSGGHTESVNQKTADRGRILSYRSNLTRHEIAVEYAKSNVAIVSSLYEGFGFPVGEAMACAIPLIATNVASIPEITQSFAELIPAKVSDAIEVAIKKYFYQPGNKSTESRCWQKAYNREL